MPESSNPSPRHAWHRAPGRTGSGRAETRQARLRKIYIIAAVMLVLAGAVAALLLYPREPPRPSLAVLRIDQYQQPFLAFSPWATKDRDALRHLGIKEKNTFTSQEKELLKQALQTLGREQAADQPLIIYLCAYAVVQNDGTVAVLPADARLDEPVTWFPFKEILLLLQHCPVKRRLLLLDLGQPCVVPEAGLFAANVPEHLKPMLETAIADDPNLQILTACGPGQASLTSEELGRSVFVHYLVQGLAGGSSPYPNKKPGTRVMVREFVDYVKTHVDRWTFYTTGQRQIPEFFSASKTPDYELTGTDDKTLPETNPLPSDYPSFLLNGWAERDRWLSDRLARTLPELIRHLEQTLLRADDQWRKGADSATVESALKSALGDLQEARTARLGSPARSEPRSLAAAVARGQKPPTESFNEARRQLKELGNLWAAVNRPKPNEKPSETDVARLTKDKETFLKKYDDKPFDLAWTIFAVAKDNELRRDHLLCWCELLQAYSKPLPPYAELVFLQRLGDLPVAKPEDWPPAAADALQLVDLAERVETNQPAAQPWLQTEYREARDKRQAAESLLFSLTAAERLQATAAVAAAKSTYDKFAEDLKTLRDVQGTCDRALVFLPGVTSLPLLEEDQARLTVWLDALKNAQELHQLLNMPLAPNQTPPLREAQQKALTLQDKLKSLREPIDAVLARGANADSRSPRPADYLKMRALLRFPGLTEAERKMVWKNTRDMGGKLKDDAVQREAALEKLNPPDEAVDLLEESNRAKFRKEIAQGLQRLAEATKMDRDAPRKNVH